MVTTITPNIVTVNTTVTYAPEPSQLQQSGALVSLGGSTLSTNAYQYCGNLSQVQAIIGTTGNYAELLDMATTFFAQGGAVGIYVLELGTAATAETLQTWITMNSSPQIFYAYLTPTEWDTQEGVNQVTITLGGSGYTAPPTVTFSAPTSGTTATGTAVVQNGVVTQVYITNPGSGYTSTPTVTFSAPASGTTATATATLGNALSGIAGNYASPNGMTYFVATTTSTNIAQYAPVKSMVCWVPAANDTSFSAAAWLYQWVSQNPSIAAPAAPMQFRFVYGVTPWVNNSTTNAQINTVLTAKGNLALTGSQGGISQASIFRGTTMDGSQAMFWYAVDWFQIQAAQQLSAAVINGSNGNPPLVYNQRGVNTLETIAQNVANSSISFGLNLSAVVSATPFYAYTQANPSDYAAGIYNGLACSVTPQLGFESITFNLAATQFVAGG